MSSDWMHIWVELPPREGAALMRLLREEFGFTDAEWSEIARPDGAFANYTPTPRPQRVTE